MVGWCHACRLAGVFLLAALLAGCVHRPPATLDPGTHLPSQVELGDTPFFPQERYQCGPAALATLLNVRGVKIDPEALVPQVYLPAREGSLQAEMIAAVRRQGLLAIPVEASLDGLLGEVSAGRPVLVLQNLGLDLLPRWHYAVVIGYDLDRQHVVLRSGTEARRVTPVGVFMNTWDRSKRWGFVVLAPDDLPPNVKPDAWLEAASGLEALGHWTQAHAAYHAATRRWPDHALAWFGLGNAAYALSDGAGAEQALRQAVAVRPDWALAWNNLAHALAARRCVRAARDAARCAARLAPGHAEIMRTQGEIEALSVPSAETCTAPPACPGR
ncbi:MAG: PA2778 family cysteine peptidase [Gammaproteobacteria bacterium]